MNDSPTSVTESTAALPRRLAIFTKYWEPGRVKTRLAAAIGAVPAAMIYRQMLDTLTAQLQSTAARKQLIIDPIERADEFRTLVSDNWEIVSQCCGDLGRRLQHFFGSAFTCGNHPVVVIGSDCLTLDNDDIERAFAALQTHDAVIGPTEDGGYYLLGLRRPLAQLFCGIEWSTSHVLAQTQQRMRDQDANFVLLEEKYDVDQLADLQRLAVEILNEPDTSFKQQKLVALIRPWLES